jgi:hypothetical protein
MVMRAANQQLRVGGFLAFIAALCATILPRGAAARPASNSAANGCPRYRKADRAQSAQQHGDGTPDDIGMTPVWICP